MHVDQLHSWTVTPDEARRIQCMLAARVERGPALHLEHIRTVAAFDLSSVKESPLLTAGVVICDVETMEILETAEAQAEATFPYIPGLLSFRETPVYLQLLAQLPTEPDVVFVDGHGLSHPRRFGIACHLGLLLDRPTIGVAKSRLVGEHSEPAPEPHSTMPLLDGHEQIGMVLRTKEGTAPLYVSIGHKVDLPSAVEFVLHCLRGYRLPEPARLAHLHVNAVRRSGKRLLPQREKQISLFSVE